MGSLIVRQVIADLIPLGLGRTQGGELLLAGSSAGGLGVMLNLDKVKSYLRDERDIRVAVRGVSDSGWFLDRDPFAQGAISAAEVVKHGWKLWGGSLPEACTNAHPAEPWRCYFGHRLYPTLKCNFFDLCSNWWIRFHSLNFSAPLFVFQWLFDEAQMKADSVGAPVTKKQWDYIHDTGIALRASLDNVTAVFAPSCIGHSVLSKRDWLSIKIDDISLPEALRCWERSTKANNKELSRRASDGKKKRNRRKGKNGQQKRKNRKNQERHRQSKERRQQQRRRRNGLARRIVNQAAIHSQDEIKPPRFERSHNHELKSGGSVSNNINQKTGRRRKNQQLRHNRNNNIHNNKRRMDHGNGQRTVAEPTRCSLRLLERCSWPQCNHSCPSITNPLTGKEMRFLELLASFGLDIEAVATALGINMTTLSNMDRTELLNLLTQTS